MERITHAMIGKTIPIRLYKNGVVHYAKIVDVLTNEEGTSCQLECKDDWQGLRWYDVDYVYIVNGNRIYS